MHAPAVNARVAELQRHERMSAATTWRQSTAAVTTAQSAERTIRYGVAPVSRVTTFSTVVLSLLAGLRGQAAV